MAEEGGGLGDNLCAARVERGADQIFWRAAFRAPAAVESEPVAESAPSIHIGMRADTVLHLVRREVIEIADHAGVMLAQDLLVAVTKVDRPRADECGIGPGGATVSGQAEGLSVWDDGRDGTIGTLGVAHVLKPLVEEATHIHKKRGRADEDLGVAGPSEAFVALRTVGGGFEKIALLPPDDVARELVQERMRTRKVAGSRDIGVEDDTHDGFDDERGRNFLPQDLDVAESVEGEPGFPLLDPFAFQRVVVGGAGAAEVFGVKRTVGFQGLRVAKPKMEPAGTAHPDPHAAGEVLPEIEPPPAGFPALVRAG